MNENELDTMRKLLDEDDMPEWSEEDFANAEIRIGGEILRPASGALGKRGRPRSEAPKRQVTLRLDGEVLDHFRAGGRGWQGRINDVLKQAVLGNR